MRTIFAAIACVLLTVASASAQERTEPRPEPERVPTYVWFFTGRACPPCIQMKAEIEQSQTLRAKLAKLRVFKKEYENEDDRRFFADAGVVQFPTIVVYDQDQFEMRRRDNYPSFGGVFELLKLLR